MTFQIEVLLTENELAEQFLAALEQRHLPEKFFYWFPLSVKAWLDLCQGEQPYKNFSRSYQLVSRHAQAIARQSRAEKIEVVSLGAGQGDKDLLVLRGLEASGIKVRYRPVDPSQALLEMATQRAAAAGFPVRGLKAEVENPRTAEVLAPQSRDEPRLFLVLGNTLGVIDPLEFLRTLRALARREDRFLVDGEMFSAEDTLAGYDNPVNRRFAFAPLASVGLEDGRDGALIFTSETDARRDGLHRLSKHFRAARDLAIAVAGRRVGLASGETLAMHCSYKYARPTFLGLLREAGLEPLDEFLSEDERFLMVFAAPGAK